MIIGKLKVLTHRYCLSTLQRYIRTISSALSIRLYYV